MLKKTKYNFITTEIRSKTMSKIRNKDTKPELKLRKALWTLGYRYRKNYNKIAGNPDLVFIGEKIAIFIDGEFWHGYNWKEKKLKIKSNKEYWIPKIERNIERDIATNKKLHELGWTVLRFWSKEISNDIDKCIDTICKRIKKI